MKRRKTKYKHKFDRFVLKNRWKSPHYSRDGSWVFFGIGIRYFSATNYHYFFSCIGLEFRLWFTRSWSFIKKDKT